MSQTIWGTIVPSTTSGTALATLLNDFKNAVVSGFIGAARPTNLQAGGYWIDNSLEGTQNIWIYKVYTGSVDIEIFRVNMNTNSASISGSDSSFQILKISADAVGPQLKLIKNRIANNAQVLTDDIVGEIQFIGAGDDASSPTVAVIKSVALDDMGASASGACLVFEAVPTGQTALSEMMRLVDGLLGIGTASPQDTVHAVGNYRGELAEDSTNSSQFIFRKKRIASLGAVLENDQIGKIRFDSTDDTGTEITSTAAISVSATEDHTSTGNGTKLTFEVTKNTENTPTAVLILGETADFAVQVSTPEMAAGIISTTIQDIATTAEILQLDSSVGVIRFTGSTATSIKGILATTSKATNLCLINGSSAKVTLVHESSGASAADRIAITGSLDAVIEAGASVELVYSPTEARWRIKGSSSGSIADNLTQSIAAAGSLTLPTKYLMNYLVDSTGGAVTISTTPFGSTAPGLDGTEATLIGNSDTNTITITHSDVPKGFILNGNIEFKKYTSLKVKWNATLDRWIEISRNNLGV